MIKFVLFYFQQTSGERADQKEEIYTHALPDYLLTDVIPRNRRQILRKFPSFLSYYAKKVFPDKLDDGIAQALENHIEGMEPQFQSASFSQLWHALKLPLTNLFRPKSSEKLSQDLRTCLPNDKRDSYRYPTDAGHIKRDLIICRIGEILDHVTGSGSGSDSATHEQSFSQLWNLLKEPLTHSLLIADLSKMIEELLPCFPRFELAGIQYKLPSRMSDIQRDVVICKVDELFNELYNSNVLY